MRPSKADRSAGLIGVGAAAAIATELNESKEDGQNANKEGGFDWNELSGKIKNHNS
jgi:hypothetical protein